MAFWNLQQLQQWFAERKFTPQQREALAKEREARGEPTAEKIGSAFIARIKSRLRMDGQERRSYHRLVWVRESTLLSMDDAGRQTIGKPSLAAMRDDGSIILWPKPQHGFNLYTE